MGAGQREHIVIVVAIVIAVVTVIVMVIAYIPHWMMLCVFMWNISFPTTLAHIIVLATQTSKHHALHVGTLCNNSRCNNAVTPYIRHLKLGRKDLKKYFNV